MKLFLIGLIVGLVGLFGSSLFFEGPSLGTFNFVSSGTYQLAGGGVSSSDTTVVINNFLKPVSLTKYDMASEFGSIGYITFEPGNSTRKEFASFTGFTYSGNNATLTGVTRGLEFNYPYTASSTLQKSHAGGTSVIISNPPQLYNQLATKANNETISGLWTFSATPVISSNCANPTDACNKAYVDSVALSGAATSTFLNGGIVELAKHSELAAGTASSSPTGPLVVSSGMTNATPGSCNTVACIPVAVAGKIAQGFLDLTQLFAFTKITSTDATSTSFAIGGPAFYINGINYRYPAVSSSASSSVLKSDGSNSLSWGLQDASALDLSSNLNQSTANTSTTTLSTYTITPNTLPGASNRRIVISAEWTRVTGSNCQGGIAIGSGAASTTIGFTLVGRIGVIELTLSATSTTGGFSYSRGTNYTDVFGSIATPYGGDFQFPYDFTQNVYLAFQGSVESGGSGTCKLVSRSIQLLSK